MSDEGIKRAIQGQASAEIIAFKLWCKRQGIDPSHEKAVGMYRDERFERMEALKAEREGTVTNKKKPAT